MGSGRLISSCAEKECLLAPTSDTLFLKNCLLQNKVSAMSPSEKHRHEMIHATLLNTVATGWQIIYHFYLAFKLSSFCLFMFSTFYKKIIGFSPLKVLFKKWKKNTDNRVGGSNPHPHPQYTRADMGHQRQWEVCCRKPATVGMLPRSFLQVQLGAQWQHSWLLSTH